MNDHRVKVANGRFEFVFRRAGARIDVLRHGQPWVQDLGAAAAVASKMAELDAARVVVQAARETVAAVQAKRARGEDFDPRYFPLALAEALTLHDALVDDREPPSAWCGEAVAADAPSKSDDIDLAVSIAETLSEDAATAFVRGQLEKHELLLDRKNALERLIAAARTQV